MGRVSDRKCLGSENNRLAVVVKGDAAMGLLRGKAAFILALVMGAVAAMAAYQYIQQRSQLPPPAIEMTKVVVAAQDIPARTKVTAGMLRQQDIPRSAKLVDAVTSVKDAEGKVTRLAVSEGEQVLARKFTAQREESGLTFYVPPSKRAVSIKVNEVIGSGGNILPGDRVDIIGVFDAKTMGKDMAAVILQDIEVLAVAQIMEGQEAEPAKSIVDAAGGAFGSDQKNVAQAAPAPTRPKLQPEAKSITVDPEQAQRLVLASGAGACLYLYSPAGEASVIPWILSAIAFLGVFSGWMNRRHIEMV